VNKPLSSMTAISCVLAMLGITRAQEPTSSPSRPVPSVAARGPTLAAAVAAAQTAMSACAVDGYRVSVSVVDSAGVLKLLMAADGTPQRPVETSIRKGYTAAILKQSTGEIAQQAHSDQALATRINGDPRFVALPGGLPVKEGPEFIGALAVAGAPGGEKDEACARAGIEKLRGEGK
jgi:uncharacterized protein GlcG (DUF336 family)